MVYKMFLFAGIQVQQGWIAPGFNNKLFMSNFQVFQESFNYICCHHSAKKKHQPFAYTSK